MRVWLNRVGLGCEFFSVCLTMDYAVYFWFKIFAECQLVCMRSCSRVWRQPKLTGTVSNWMTGLLAVDQFGTNDGLMETRAGHYNERWENILTACWRCVVRMFINNSHNFNCSNGNVFRRCFDSGWEVFILQTYGASLVYCFRLVKSVQDGFAEK